MTSHLDSGSDFESRFAEYQETVLVFRDLVIDLREPVSSEARAALRTLGLARPFGIFTSFNPRGSNLPEEENAERLKQLEQDLAEAGLDFVKVDGCSPDRSHCECSYAVETSRDEVIEMAKRWEQIAIFWWDGTSFWIYGALLDTQPLELPDL